MDFGKDFLWGAATASAQIEGGWKEDGRGPSIWDYVYPKNGCSKNGADARITCEHYSHWREDVALMKEMGLKAYRFSISWSRLYPAGYGRFNEKGAEFYDKLINELIKNGIKPVITCYHWDMPEAVFQRGGWFNPDCAKWFADYCAKIVELYSDRVDMFLTINEPECFVDIGYNSGGHAPFAKYPFDRVLQLMHRVLIANGMAVRAMRKAAKQPIQIGMAPAIWAPVPATENPADIEAARYKAFHIEGRTVNKAIAFAETALTGKYPECIEKEFGSWFEHPESDMEIIHAPFDFFAYNTYSAEIIKAGKDGPETVPFDYNTHYTATDWAITPDCLYWSARFLYERYKLPIIISENGVATVDIPDENGVVNDDSRIQYLRQHLRGAKRAISEGIPIKGYFYWSLMDNYEWGMGFTKRFGMVYIDYNTQKRTLKKSASWYRNLIDNNGENL